MNPEGEVPDSSLITKFRKTHIQSEEISDEMLGETIKQAIGKGLIKSTALLSKVCKFQSGPPAKPEACSEPIRLCY